MPRKRKQRSLLQKARKANRARKSTKNLGHGLKSQTKAVMRAM